MHSMRKPISQDGAAVTTSPPASGRRTRGDAVRKESAGNTISAEGGATAAADVPARLYTDPYAAALERQLRADGTGAAPHRTAAVTKQRPVAPSVRREREAASTACVPPPTAEERAASAAAALAEAGEVVCVEVPAAPASHSSGFTTAAAAGGRLELRMRGLTALPCLHAPASPDAPSVETPGGDAAGASPASAHGSGDAVAGRLHAVSLRQNALTTLLTHTARAASLPQTPALLPRGSPLQCYAHVSSLDLTHNALVSIAGIEALRCLRSLRLACNRLTSLSPLWASPYVAELDVLDVSANLLTELLSDDDVRALEGHHVRLVTHPTQAQSAAGKTRSVKSGQYKSMRLRVLYASSNQLREVPSALYSMTQLADLRLNKNAIAAVPEGFPSRLCLPNLARLDLSMNELPGTTAEAVAARVEGAVDGAARRSSRAVPSAATAPAAVAADTIAPCAAARRPARSGRSRSESSVSRSAGATRTLSRVAPRSPSPPPRSTTSVPSAPAAPQSQAARREKQQQQQQPAPSPPPAGGSPTKRKKPPPLPQAATASAAPLRLEAEALSAVRCLAENVYSVDLSRWAAVVHRRLGSLLEPAPLVQDTGAPPTYGAQPALVSLGDILAALSESLSGGASAAGPRPRQRHAGSARAVTLLQQCLPACTLSFIEETQTRSPPLLMLTGIAPAAVAAQDELLLLEVLALHLVTNCLSTARPLGGGGSTPQTRSATPSPTPQLTEQPSSAGTTNGSTPPPPPQDRGANEPPAIHKSSGARFTRSGSGASRLLNFASGLHIVHVLDATAVTPAGGSTAASIALTWTYVAWRQRWEAAVGRRRFRHRNSFVCEMKASGATARLSQSRSALTSPGDPPLANGAAQDTAAGAAHTARYAAAMMLYPFPGPNGAPRVAEWRRLREHRPALYAAVPLPWELLYDGLLRANTPALALPPLLSGAGSHAYRLGGQPVPLASLLLCAVDLPNTATAPVVAPSRPIAGRGGVAVVRPGLSPSASTAVDIVGAAQRWQQRTCELWHRVEGEAATLAAEQQTQCPLPVYGRAEVRRSQRTASNCLCGTAVAPSSSEEGEASEADGEASDGEIVSPRASRQQSVTEATTPHEAATPDTECAAAPAAAVSPVEKDSRTEVCEPPADGAEIAASGAAAEPQCLGDDTAPSADAPM